MSSQDRDEKLSPARHHDSDSKDSSLPPGSSSHPGGGAPSSQVPGHPSFRRQRASRACETCHARKVRCDAASLGVPCTNCVAFSIECKIPAPKRKKQGTKSKDSDSEKGDSIMDNDQTGSTGAASPSTDGRQPRATLYSPEEYQILDIQPTDEFTVPHNSHTGNFAQVMKPKFVRAPIKEAGRVAYLGESSNLSLLVQDKHGSTDVVHYPLPDHMRGTRAKLNELDNVEIEILHQRGAFLLPPRGLCDELVEAFFTWVAPVCPVVNRTRFMRRYRDSKNPPSLLLLQAILLAGSRVCRNPQLMDSNGSTTPAAMTFYKRAKALFDANYEDDRVTIVQATVLMGWYWEGPEDVTRNVFFWTRVAATIAQGSGMHRSVESSQLSRTDKRLCKRIWWTLFTRDRSVAVALGRPCCINVDDSDVEMLTEEDFLDDDVDRTNEYAPDPIHVHFFLNYIKLTEIMGLVLSQQYSVKGRKHNALDLTHSDMALADWLQNCPRDVSWEKSRHHFWSGLLHANYYTTLCLLHRAHMPPAGTPTTIVQDGNIIEATYPSRNIAYQAAGQITSIIECLQKNDQLRFTPAFIVYSLFSALIMHVYQMRSSNAAIVTATEQRLQTCMNALKEVAKVWLVAKMVHTLFESILGNKHLEERLQKAAGRRHQRNKSGYSKHGANLQPMPQQVDHSGGKRKFDEVDMGFNSTTPSAQMSYERSRPQTPALTPNRDLAPQQNQGMPAMAPPGNSTGTSPKMPRSDAFMGNSTTGTRQTTPQFQPQPTSRSAFIPNTPPDLFLVTRNSPTISQDMWNNFQPDQLFPEDSSISMSNLSPGNTGVGATSYIDPQLAQGSLPASKQDQQQQQQQQTQPFGYQTQTQTQSQSQSHPPLPHRNSQQNGLSHSSDGTSRSHHQHQQSTLAPSQHDPSTWANLSLPQTHHPQPQHQHQNFAAEDAWSTSSLGGTSNSGTAGGGGAGGGGSAYGGSGGGAGGSGAGLSAPVPTTLNVEDWFQFFGINGDLNGMRAYGV